MRYLKGSIAAVAALAVLWFFAEIIVNIDSLAGDFRLQVGWLPWAPQGALVTQVWVAILAAFFLAFSIVLVMEMIAWYEYSRTIRIQRKQILALQDQLGKEKSGHDSASI